MESSSAGNQKILIVRKTVSIVLRE